MLEIPETNHEISGDMPLGIGESSTYTQLDIPVQTGDMVICFTDGVIESADSNGELLGVAGLQAILNDVPADQPDQILVQVVNKLTSNEQDFSRKDDVTMLLYRITNRAVPLRDNLAAPFRWVKGLFHKQT